MNNRKEIIHVKNIFKTYPIKTGKLFQKEKKKAVLSDISFSVNKGEIISIVGESGSGKSTLVKILAHLLVYDEGQVYFEGKNIKQLSGVSLKTFRRDVQLILQDSKGVLNPNKKIGWILQEPLKVHFSMTKGERLKMVAAYLQAVGLDESYLESYPHQLSGGQAQRVSIVTSLLLKSQVLICDEITSSLDVSVQGQILNLLIELNQKYHVTIIFITHDLNIANYISHRTAIMYDGQIMEIGDSKEILDAPLHPYSKLLMASHDFTHNEIKTYKNVNEEIQGCSFFGRCPNSMEQCSRTRPHLYTNQDREVRCFLFEKNNDVV